MSGYVNPKIGVTESALEIVQWLQRALSAGTKSIGEGKRSRNVSLQRPLEDMRLILSGMAEGKAFSGNESLLEMLDRLHEGRPYEDKGKLGARDFNLGDMRRYLFSVTKDGELKIVFGERPYSDMMFSVSDVAVIPIEELKLWDYGKEMIEKLVKVFGRDQHFDHKKANEDLRGGVDWDAWRILESGWLGAAIRVIGGKIEELRDVILTNGLANPVERWAPPELSGDKGAAAGVSTKVEESGRV